MRIFIDCEFNEFQGELISMALVAENGDEWHEVLECSDPKPWVKANVIPILNKDPVVKLDFQAKLWKFLRQYDSLHIVADFPVDLTHFLESLVTGPGCWLSVPPLTLEVIPVDIDSKLPHNALSDARAVMEAVLTLEAQRSQS